MSAQELPNDYQVIDFNSFGDPTQLHISTREMPVISSQQVLVKNLATSINPIDYKTRQGIGWAAQQNANNLPMILGYDVIGEVVAIGDDVTDFAVGESVIGFVGFPLQAGCYGQYVAASELELVKINRQYNALASLPLAGLTAYQGLFDVGKLKAGDTVLIGGASGCVGYLAVQLALNAGAKVLALASASNHDKLTSLGDVTVLDYRQLDAFSGLPTINLWFDLVGGDHGVKQILAANDVQRVVTVPTVTKDMVEHAIADKVTSVEGMLVCLDKKQLTILAQAVENKALRLNIAKYMNYNDAIRAHALAESGQLSGKIVLTLN